jgi:hypothetical protein
MWFSEMYTQELSMLSKFDLMNATIHRKTQRFIENVLFPAQRYIVTYAKRSLL